MSLVCILVLFMVGCAHQALPPGGPEDKIPPLIIACFPPPDTVGVDPKTEILISFTEEMDRTSVEEATFISPALIDPPHFRWQGNDLRIEPLMPLSLDRTYVITIGTTAQDLHNNQFLQPYTLAFSTGVTIDLGAISGLVVSRGRPLAGVTVMSYLLGLDPDPRLDEPDYFTQSDQDGRFRLDYLGPGIYRLFAMEDRNRNRLWDLATEALAVPPTDVVLSEAQPMIGGVNMALAMRDSAGPALLSARPLDARTVILRFDQEMDTSTLLLIGNYTITSEEGYLLLESVYSIPGYNDRIALRTVRQSPNLGYRVSVEGVVGWMGTLIDSSASWADFDGVSTPDTVRPRLIDTFPRDGAVHLPLDIKPRFLFSEPMETSSVVIYLSTADSTALNVGGDLRWEQPTIAVFSTFENLLESTTYLVKLDAKRIFDLSGNPLADSLATISFTTLKSDTLGTVTGRIMASETTLMAPVVIMAEQPSGLAYHVVVEDSMRYRLVDIMPGAYALTAFLDLDRDGRHDLGSALPFRTAEPFTVYSDTVIVRSRWKTSGVDLQFGPSGD